MRKLIFHLSGIIICLLGLTGQGAAQTRPLFLDEDVEYLWPTNASSYMSSSFGETRSAHFHAALDIGTWGRTGYPIYATRDGILHRVGVGPRDYGNVVYLKHDDGSYSLYAHLDDFVPEIRQLVDSIRFVRDYSFTFDEVLEEHNIRFRQGEQIAVSGETGVGPPHLHFELRTPAGLPFNPLLTNLSVPDTTPPRFVSLSVEPLSADALVAGGKTILRKRADSRHFGTIPVSGAVGLGIDVFDQSDNAGNVYAVYDLKLNINGELYFHSRIDSFSYDNTHQMFLDRVYPILRESQRGFQRLYVKGANTLPFYSETGRSGIVRLPAGRHHFEIIAEDYFGNRSRADGYLAVAPQVPVAFNHNRGNTRLPAVYSNTTALLNLARWNWHNDWLAPDVIPDGDLTVTVHTPGSFRHDIREINLSLPGRAIDLSGPFSRIIELNAGESYMLHRVAPGAKTDIYSTDQRASVSFGPGSVYDTMSVGLHYTVGPGGYPRVRLYPEHQPMGGKARLGIVLDRRLAAKDNLAFYYRHPRRDSYERVDSAREGALLTGEIGHFDTFYVLEDSLAPDVSDPDLFRGAGGRWILSVRAGDDLSGIDYEATKFYCNGIRGIAEYDPENDLIRYHHPDFEPRSQNTIRVVVADQAGNVTTGHFTVRK
ncbi:MAG: M23 family metallopeptidase [Balneolales bacterium]